MFNWNTLWFKNVLQGCNAISNIHFSHTVTNIFVVKNIIYLKCQKQNMTIVLLKEGDTDFLK